MNRFLLFIAMFSLIALTLGCATPKEGEEKESKLEPKAPRTTIKLATTTSFDNSGLLAHILPIFTKETGIDVDVLAVGTGKALQHGRAGDVDVVLVHAPKAEQEFIDEGYGLSRHYICQNEFVIVGPEADPAGISVAENAAQAMKMIMNTKSKFISRGDESGTHKREKKVWKQAGVTPSGDWYVEAGQGMGAVLTMANEMQAYTLTDTATYFSMIDKLTLAIIFSGDPILENIYSVILLNPEKIPDARHEDARKFAEWITSSETGELISDYEVNGYTLFTINLGAVEKVRI